jgi:hypothetical protein
MSMIESEAVFSTRAELLGVDAATLALMRAAGWRTLGTFGFACSYVPGASDDSTFKKDVLEVLFGAEPSPMAPSVRRLYFESYSISASEMRGRLEQRTDDAPKRMAIPERVARSRKLEALIAPLKLLGVREPAFHLVDTMVQFIEIGILTYVPWSQCQSRNQELVGTKLEKGWAPDSSGTIKEITSLKVASTDTSTDLKFTQALQRRGYAFSMANLMDHVVHDTIVNLFMDELGRDPPDGYARTSLLQVERADKEIFRQLSDTCRGTLAPSNAGIRPLDAQVPVALASITVRMLLMPLQGLAKRSASDGDGTGVLSKNQMKKQKKALAQSTQKAQSSQASKPAHGPKQAKPNRPGQGYQKHVANPKAPFVPMPAALRGHSAMTPAGNRICFSFNLGSCTAQNCPKGDHVCVKCFRKHALPTAGQPCPA